MIFNSERNKIEKLTYDNPNCRNIFSFLFPFSPFSDSKLDWNLFEKVREGIRKKKLGVRILIRPHSEDT